MTTLAAELLASLDEDEAYEAMFCRCGGTGRVDIHDQVGDDDLPNGYELIAGRIHVPCRDHENEEG